MTYVYSISSDFTNASEVDIDVLHRTIDGNSTVGVNVDKIFSRGDAVTISMTAALDVTQKTELDSIVAAYQYVAIPPAAKTLVFDAIVSNDLDSVCDFHSISEAFAAGRNSVFVKNGTYIETADVVIPDGGQLVGECPGKVYIVFVGPTKVKIDAVTGNPKETTGTVSIANASATVTGTGTTFTNLTPGQFILIGTNYFPIVSIESDTSLTIADTYHGNSIVGQSLLAHSVFSGVRFANCIIYGNTVEGLHINGIRNSAIQFIAIYKCGAGVVLKNSADLSINSVIVNSCNGVGFVVDSCQTISLNTVNNYNNNGHGFNFKGTTVNVNFETSTSESNGGHGVYIEGSGCSYVNITDGVVKRNLNDGVRIDSGSMYISITSIESTDNGGAGVTVNGECTCISEGFINGNSGVGISLGSTARHVKVNSNCIKSNSGNGVTISAGNETSILAGNTISTNSGHGIETSGVKFVIDGNDIDANTLNGIVVNPTANAKSVISDNMITSNVGGKGILVNASTSKLSITSNVVDANSTQSIELETGTDKCLVSANNTDVAIANNATNSVVVNNLV